MSSVQLLDKTRKINQLLHNNNSGKVVFNDICEVLTEILNSSVLVISRKGKVLGVSHCQDFVQRYGNLSRCAIFGGLLWRCMKKCLFNAVFEIFLLPLSAV